VASFRFGLLGPFLVEAGGTPVEIAGRRPKMLLAILLTNANRVVPSDRLIDDLWTGNPTPGATATLHGYLSELRKTLAQGSGRPAPIVTQRPGYVIHVDRSQLDILAFEHLIDMARAAARDQPELVGTLLDQALRHWRGPALVDFAGELFAEPVIARLEEARLWAVEERVEIGLARGHHGELATELRDLTRQHPLRERLWGQWMLALYRCGRQAEALRAYQELRHRLGEDLAIEPSPSVQGLEYAILTQDASLAAPAEGSVTAPASADLAPSSPRHNLPAPLTRFIGRTRELEEARRLLAAGRVLTITGSGGSGKTRFAIELATQQAMSFADGARFVDLAAVTDSSSVPGAVAAALRLSEHGGSDTESLLDHLEGSQTLLLLDNCEHVVEACASFLSSVLLRCPSVTVLATSRQELRIWGETVWRMPTLGLPPSDAPATEIAASEAVQLFLERASPALPASMPDRHTLLSVADVCRRLEGIPLAIELAAGLLGVLPVGEIARRLEDRFSLLARGSRSAVPRQRTLRAAIDWSYDLLEPSERELFARLAVFVGEFSFEAAEAVAASGDSFVADLCALVEKSMLVTISGPAGTHRYRLLDTLREYGLDRLRESGADADVRKRHAGYYTSFAEAADRQLHSRDQSDWSTQLSRELPNIRAALEWAFAEQELELGLRLAGALRWWFVIRMDQFTQVKDLLDKALARRHELSPSLRLKALTPAMAIAFIQADYRLASTIGEEAIGLADELGDRTELVAALLFSGGAAVYKGELAPAVDYLERSLDVSRQVGDRWGSAWALTFWGTASRRAGDEALAKEQLEEALTLFRDLRDGLGQVIPLMQLGLLAQETGAWDEAIRLCDEAIRLGHELRGHQLAYGARCIAGRVRLAQGRRDEARELLLASVSSSRRMEHQLMVALAVEGLAIIAQDEGRHRLGVELWGYADELRSTWVIPLLDQRLHERERYLADARGAVGAEVVAHAFAAGRDLSLHEAISRFRAVEV